MASPAFREAPTLHAISQLRRNYPYAAAILTYVVIERVLKVHLLTSRRTSSFPNKKMSRGPHKGRPLAALVNLRDAAFLKDILCHMTLGEVEDSLNLRQSARSSQHRNEAVHSNLYLSHEATLTHQGRRRKNAARLKQAVAHLRYVVNNFTDHRLVERRSGELIAQPNLPIQPSGSAGG